MPYSVESGEEMHEIHENKIEQRHVTAEQQHGDDDDQSRISQLFVAPEPLFLGIPGPRALLQLGSDFAEKVFCSGDHRGVIR